MTVVSTAPCVSSADVQVSGLEDSSESRVPPVQCQSNVSSVSAVDQSPPPNIQTGVAIEVYLSNIDAAEAVTDNRAGGPSTTVDAGTATGQPLDTHVASLLDLMSLESMSGSQTVPARIRSTQWDQRRQRQRIPLQQPAAGQTHTHTHTRMLALNRTDQRLLNVNTEHKQF